MGTKNISISDSKSFSGIRRTSLLCWGIYSKSNKIMYIKRNDELIDEELQ